MRIYTSANNGLESLAVRLAGRQQFAVVLTGRPNRRLRTSVGAVVGAVRLSWTRHRAPSVWFTNAAGRTEADLLDHPAVDGPAPRPRAPTPMGASLDGEIEAWPRMVQFQCSVP